MSSRQLKNKPLLEAIFEMRWPLLVEKAPGLAVDPHYRLLLGRIYDRLQPQYPEHEPLDSANMPDEMAGHVVQHRFRTGPNDWPLIQIGPGVFTVNDTDKYKWDDFRERVLGAQRTLYEAYPQPHALKVDNLMLRYIDAVELDYQTLSIFEFLRDKLKVSVSLHESLFEGTQVEPIPQHFNSRYAYRSREPKGTIQLKLATGRKNDKPALIWETTLQTLGDDMPTMPTEFATWLDGAHTLVNDWFFKMIDGDLRRIFSEG